MGRYDPDLKPILRPVEARVVEFEHGTGYLLHDPAGLADAVLSVSEPALFILALFDGQTTLAEIRAAFSSRFGQVLAPNVLGDLVSGLEDARLLRGEAFDRHYADLVSAYLAAPARPMRSAAELGLDGDAAEVIAEVLASAPTIEPIGGDIVGLVAPHLDYGRGHVCYSAAYSTLVNRPAPQRVVVLGTNHFGRSTSAVASGKDFETPLGVTRADLGFLEALEARCGPLREHEYDHACEHSVELQLLICQHLWGAAAFEMVAVLCPDPCGPTGTQPYDGAGVDLREFGEALRATIAADGRDTLVIAGADLSHMGAHFGDDRPLDEDFRREVEARDAAALARLEVNAPEEFRAQVARDDNPTRVCSAGCVFAAMIALPDAQVRVLRYHQAVDEQAQVGVTCAAAVFVARRPVNA